MAIATLRIAGQLCSVLLYGGETWSMLVGDVRWSEIFDYRCLRNITGIGWNAVVSNVEVRDLMLDAGSWNTLYQHIELSRLG